MGRRSRSRRPRPTQGRASSSVSLRTETDGYGRRRGACLVLGRGSQRGKAALSPFSESISAEGLGPQHARVAHAPPSRRARTPARGAREGASDLGPRVPSSGSIPPIARGPAPRLVGSPPAPALGPPCQRV